MKQQTDHLIAMVAIALLVLSAVAVWDVAGDRDRKARDARTETVVEQQVSSRQLQGDYDGDGVSDATDTCPTRPETENQFQDDDGCPDVVATTGAS